MFFSRFVELFRGNATLDKEGQWQALKVERLRYDRLTFDAMLKNLTVAVVLHHCYVADFGKFARMLRNASSGA